MKKVYSTYKETDIPWAKEIPSEWDIEKGKWLFQKENRPVREEDEVVTAFRDGEVTLRKNRREDGFTFSLKEIGYQGIRKGDLVIHGMDAFAGAIGVSDSDGKSSPVYNACTLRQEGEPWYFCHAVREMSRSGYIQSLAKGIRERSTDFRFDTFGEQLLPVPSLTEQRQISAYLDCKCALIDTFIAKKKRLIELLQEQKQAIINQAVTRGIDPDVSLKPSGLDWLGDIPAHWEVKKLKYVAGLNPGRKKLDVSSLAVFLPMEKVGEDGTIDCSIQGKVEDLQSGYTYFEKGDVIVAKITPCFENGKGAYLKGLETEVGFGSTEFHVLRPDLKEVLPEYLHSILRSEKFRSLGEYHMVGSAGQKRVPTSFISNFAIGFPGINEQRPIINFIEKESLFIDDTISRIEKELILVQEYKTTLIAEAVTGKIDVRDWRVEEKTPSQTLKPVSL